jgi:antitoxin (DNA-binding transcriptional repressor) of toxin-antitoxin stability system
LSNLNWWRILTGRRKKPRVVDLPEAEANLDRLIEDAEKGKPFTIAVEGKLLVSVSRMEKDELDKLPKPEEDESGAKGSAGKS